MAKAVIHSSVYILPVTGDIYVCVCTEHFPTVQFYLHWGKKSLGKRPYYRGRCGGERAVTEGLVWRRE